MPERLNGRDWKSRNGGNLVRGFESLPLRHLLDVRTLAPRIGVGVVLVPGLILALRGAFRAAVGGTPAFLRGVDQLGEGL